MSRAPPEAAEPLPESGEEPAAFAARAAKAKADAVYDALVAKMPVLGADTVVYLGSSILGKPRDAAEAFHFLQELSGRVHRVRTACSLRLNEAHSESFFGEAEVAMGAWPDEVLKAYANTGEGLDKAGAYAVQGLGAFLVTSVSGSWSAVIGLPVAETVAALMRHGMIEAISTP